MALQTGPLYFEGTIGGMTFYRMEGKYYVRKKTSLTRERVMADKAFERSRQAARVFGEASKLASEVYRILPKEKRKHGLIGKLSGAANRLLHEGRNQAEVAVVLLKQYAGVEVAIKEEKKETTKVQVIPTPAPVISTIKDRTELRRLFAGTRCRDWKKELVASPT